ncbi:hypothetical protein FE257_008400 [Aspergillus nanangensis]|uniref:Cytochrome P450 n=1 Tax=Aspergillus nanangensis TaxID=2582783 RepID=A0AAD4GTF3_ASPNN|nr:hypothetical protein FE257_008400 [Aspergillus nanangensis]
MLATGESLLMFVAQQGAFINFDKLRRIHKMPSSPHIINEPLNNGAIILYVAYLVLGWLVIRSVYRLWFHPLHRIPGSKLAAVTSFYEFYFDAIKGGRYLWQIEKMHEKYGPVVRINPREVHIKDSDYFHTIASGRRDKDTYNLNTIMTPNAALGTVGHDSHKVRRHIIDRVFSKLSIAKIDSMIQEKLEILMKRLNRARITGTVVDLNYTLANLTTDVISEYVYGESLGSLHEEEYQNTVVDDIQLSLGSFHYSRLSPTLLKLVRLVPMSLPGGGEKLTLEPFSRMVQLGREKSHEYLSGAISGDGVKKVTVLGALVADTVPPQEKTMERLVDESLAVLTGGILSTADVLAVALFHLGRNPSILQTLRQELFGSLSLSGDRIAWSQQSISITKLEKLPYLTAVIRESLRISHPVIVRSARVAAHATMYKDVVIPPGTPVSQSIYFVSMDPLIFPSPEIFNPDRWIEAAANGVNLTKFFVIFGSGSRACVGIHLAYAELYHIIAAFSSTFNWKLHQTGPEDVRTARDMLLAAPESGFLSIKAIITGTVE